LGWLQQDSENMTCAHGEWWTSHALLESKARAITLIQTFYELNIWKFPEMGVPQIIHFNVFLHYQPFIFLKFFLLITFKKCGPEMLQDIFLLVNLPNSSWIHEIQIVPSTLGLFLPCRSLEKLWKMISRWALTAGWGHLFDGTKMG
jgi:hypothetical protein